MNRGEVRLTGWQSSGQFGLRVSTLDRERLLRPLRDRLDSEGLILALPMGKAFMIIDFPTTKHTFWKKCPEFRSREIGDWMRGRSDYPWPAYKTPIYRAELLEPGTGRLMLRVVR